VPALGFCSGYDLRVKGWSPELALCSAGSLLKVLSPLLPAHVLSFSLILLMRELRLGGVKWLSQGHAARQ